MRLLVVLVISCFIQYSQINGQVEGTQVNETKEKNVVYFQPNTTQLFTELYQAYGLLNPPAQTFFENALYLDQSIPPTPIPLQPSNQVIFDHASVTLSEFHKRVGDLELYIDPSKPKPFFYTAVGSKQLIVALVYAIATSEPNKKFVFAEQAPYYSGHPNAVSGIFNYPNARFLAFHDPSEIVLDPEETLVEIVTSPNNPDGKFRKPQTNAQIIIADLVFASSAFGDGTGYLEKNIDWIREARKTGKHVFSFNSASKQFGKTGARCGYIWYPLYDAYAALIFKKFFGFISSSTIASGTTGLADFLNLIKAFLNMPDTAKALREDGYKSLIKRHELVKKELLSRYPNSRIVSMPGSPTLFAQIKDPRIPTKKASDVMFEDLRIVANSGEPMGENNEFIRLNLSGYSQLLVELLNRLNGQEKYTVQDVLHISENRCHRSLVSAKGSSNTFYVVNPGDCIIEADASNGPIEIMLPPFIAYLQSQVISLKKVDSSDHSVTVKAENFTITLKKLNEVVKVQWTQPDWSWTN